MSGLGPPAADRAAEKVPVRVEASAAVRLMNTDGMLGVLERAVMAGHLDASTTEVIQLREWWVVFGKAAKLAAKTKDLAG